MRIAAVEHRVEAADDHRVPQALERLRFLGQLAQRALGLGVARPQHLRDGEREQPLVPHQHDLESPAAAEVAHDAATGRDLVALADARRRLVRQGHAGYIATTSAEVVDAR